LNFLGLWDTSIVCTYIVIFWIKMFILSRKSMSERGRISNFLNKFLYETLLLQPMIILIIFSCILNIEFPQVYVNHSS
jgi:hypothetical protein